jgi:hypothetical protein
VFDEICTPLITSLPKSNYEFTTFALKLNTHTPQCGTPSAPRHIRSIRESLPGEPAVALSAASERWIASSRQQGLVLYEVRTVLLRPVCAQWMVLNR